MQTTLYISSGYIQIMVASPHGKSFKINSKTMLPIQRGSIMNGVIINDAAIAKVLQEYKEQEPSMFKKGVTLIVDSSLIIAKKLEIPKQFKKEQIDEYVKSELEPVSSTYQDPIYDYSMVEETGKKMLIACVVDQKFIESYDILFTSVGIKLNAINIAMNTLLKMIRTSPEYSQRDFILNVIDGNNMLSLLMNSSNYTLASRTRLMEEKGGMPYTSELISKISSLIQFNKTQHNNGILTEALFCWLDDSPSQEAEISQLRGQSTLIDDMMMDEMTLDGSKEPTAMIYCYAGNYKMKKDINLLALYRERTSEKKSNIRIPLPALFAALIAAGFIAAYSIISSGNRTLQSDIDEVQAYIDNPNNQEIYVQTLAMDTEIQEAESTLNNMKIISEALSQYPTLNSKKLNKLSSACGKDVSLGEISFSGASGSLSFSVQAATENSIARFIMRLKLTEIFVDVEYSGYSSNAETGISTTTIKCTIDGREGEGNV